MPNRGAPRQSSEVRRSAAAYGVPLRRCARKPGRCLSRAAGRHRRQVGALHRGHEPATSGRDPSRPGCAASRSPRSSGTAQRNAAPLPALAGPTKPARCSPEMPYITRPTTTNPTDSATTSRARMICVLDGVLVIALRHSRSAAHRIRTTGALAWRGAWADTAGLSSGGITYASAELGHDQSASANDVAFYAGKSRLKRPYASLCRDSVARRTSRALRRRRCRRRARNLPCATLRRSAESTATN